jgi:hypothetical protein
MQRAAGIVVVVIILTLVAGEFVLPWVVARGVESGLERTLGVGSDLEVSLTVRPALRMLLGRVDNITVETRRVRTATLTIDSMAVTVSDIAVNLGDILRRKLDVSRSASIGTVIRISEGNLRRYVLDNVEGLTDPQFKVFSGKAALSGYMKFAGKPVLVAAEGRFVPSGETKVAFAVDVLSIDGERLPDRVAETLVAALGGNELFIDLGKFSVPLVLREVRMSEGWLTIHATTPVR